MAELSVMHDNPNPSGVIVTLRDNQNSSVVLMTIRSNARHIFHLLVVLLTICAPAAGQKQIDGVSITGEVTNVALCSQQDDARVYRIEIKLQARNAGTEPVIISTASAMTDFYKIANTLDDLQKKGYAHIGWVTSGPGDPKSVPSAPVKPFSVVPPNTNVDIAVDLHAIVIGKLKPGPTYIQIVAENWPDYSDTYTEKIRLAWRSQGILWSHSLHPEPIAFVVPSRVEQARCR